MSDYNSSRELAEKMDSEGGLAEMLYNYGLDVDNLPKDMPEEIKYKIREFDAMADTYREIEDFFSEARDNDPIPGDWDYEAK